MTTWAASFAPLPAATSAAQLGHPVRYAVAFPERLRRLRAAFCLVLVLPALLVTAAFLWIAELLWLVGWISIVVSGQYDRTLWGFSVGCLRRQAQVATFISLLRDELPPLTGGRYPLTFEVEYAQRRSRLSTFFRVWLVTPQLLTLYLLTLPWTAAVAIGWFAVLLSGRYPRGVWLLVEGLNRWFLRVSAYLFLLTDAYPPYSLDLAASATAGSDTAPAPGAPPLDRSTPPPAYQPPFSPAAAYAPPSEQAADLAPPPEQHAAGFAPAPYVPPAYRPATEPVAGDEPEPAVEEHAPPGFFAFPAPPSPVDRERDGG